MPGRLRAARREKRTGPGRYILTSAQNDTGLHDRCWSNLLALAAHDGAQIMVGAFTYDTASPASRAAKRKTAKESGGSPEVWDSRVEPYLVDRRVELAPGLVWCGELQILPTAVNPISGLESYTARDSSIIPHVKFAVQSIASPKNRGTKFIYTTGCVTLRNYIQKKAGQKAEFHHGYGALLVEVDADGSWFVRQLNADSAGTIYDLDRKAAGGVVTTGHRPAAIVWGDIHTRQLEPGARKLHGAILNTLRPRHQVLHDVLDFRSQNHHDRDDPWRTFAKHAQHGTAVAAEVAEAAAFVADVGRPWCDTAVVRSNHDEALVRWLKEADFREDPENARFLLRATLAQYEAYAARDTKFDPIEWAFADAGRKFTRTRFLRRDEELIVCPDANGGIELGMHGDKGANGARGSLITFARTGRKCIVGDSHVAGLRDGAMQVGVSAALDQGYNEGLSAWSHTHAIVYPNGKRSLFTVWKGRWRGDPKVEGRTVPLARSRARRVS